MAVVDFSLHVLGLVLPALAVALGTTLVARWRPAAPLRGRWWMHWVLCSAAGVFALVGGLWWSGHDGRMASYAALVLVCASASWLLSLRRQG